MSTVTIKIDGVAYTVEEGGNLLQTCLDLGLDLPYFCWHPELGSVGACRQCAVVQYTREEDTHGRIVMGCMTPVTDGAFFSLDGDQARIFREAIVESLMLNHPHDCPVCAEGGECHLQDMTVMVGHRDRHYRGRKNTHRNQYLGPLIHHEMNRCITCYRCTRYYSDYAGGTDLAAMAAHDHVYFGRHQEGVLENEFAGNLVEVCPTGVFTDKSLVHDYTRKWDLQSAPSVCVGCAVGCNTLAGERYGRLKRIHNRFNRQVNGYFLCDRGRFGGKFVNLDTRLDHPAEKNSDGQFEARDEVSAVDAIANRIEQGKFAAIGSPRASCETNHLARQLSGSGQFCSGMADEQLALVQRCLRHLGSCPARNPSLRDMEAADATLILGEDVTQFAPRVALALRQAVRNKAYTMAAELNLQPWQDAAVRNLAQEQRSPLHIVAGFSTSLNDVASSEHCLTPSQQLALALEVLAELRGNGSGNSAAQTIAHDLQQAQQPLVISGTSCGNAALLDAAAAIAAELNKQDGAMLSYCLPECNSAGVGLLTLEGSLDFATLAQQVSNGAVDTLLILENDLYTRLPAADVDRMLDDCPCVIGIDILENRTLAHCDWVLPAASFIETEATLVSAELRAQRSFPAQPCAELRRPSWEWLEKIRVHRDPGQVAPFHFDAICEDCAGQNQLLAGISAAAPNHDYRTRGLKVPRQSHRYSGRTAMRADISVHEAKQTVDEESALAFTMEGAQGAQPAALQPQFWSPGWNSNQSLHKFQEEVGGSLQGGSAGVRLLQDTPLAAPEAATAPEATPTGQHTLLASYQLFGSDELSRLSEGISELLGEACVELHADTAAQLGVTEGDGVLVEGTALSVSINNSLPVDCVAYGAGFPETSHLCAGQSVLLSKAVDWVRRQPTLIGSDGGQA